MITALGHASLSEDAEFHWFQTYEAAVRQFHAWPAGSEEGALIVAGTPGSSPLTHQPDGNSPKWSASPPGWAVVRPSSSHRDNTRGKTNDGIDARRAPIPMRHPPSGRGRGLDDRGDPTAKVPAVRARPG